MALPELVSTDLKNKLEDLTGVTIQPGENPYQALLTACDDDPLGLTGQAKIQALYATHRTLRNAQQRAKLLDPAFDGLIIDPFLLRLENPGLDPGFADPRHGLVFWARPPEHVLQLAAHVQRLLKAAAPGLWLMPVHRMHMTALEIVHSQTPAASQAVVDAMAPCIPALVNYTHDPAHRTRLVKPMVSHDLAALALSFVPAVDELHASPPPVPPHDTDSDRSRAAYTYHHLRRDLFDQATATGVAVASRYVVPSAHITLARFQGQADHATPAARQAWVQAIDKINAWLEADVWPATWSDAAVQARAPDDRFVGEWVVGQERGLDARTGALWYGGGRSVMTGEGF